MEKIAIFLSKNMNLPNFVSETIAALTENPVGRFW